MYLKPVRNSKSESSKSAHARGRLAQRLPEKRRTQRPTRVICRGYYSSCTRFKRRKIQLTPPSRGEDMNAQVLRGDEGIEQVAASPSDVDRDL